MPKLTDYAKGYSFDVRIGGPRGFALAGGFGGSSSYVYSTIDQNLSGSDYLITYAAKVPGRVIQALNSEQFLWGRGSTRGAREVWSGGCTLENSDGALDWLATTSLNRQEFGAFVSRRNDRSVNGYANLMNGYIETVTCDMDKVTLYVRDYVWALDTPILTNVYAGNNSLPNGLEGTPDDIKGQKKPGVLGKFYNVTPVLVNTSRLIYQLDGQFGMMAGYSLTVRDAGIVLTAGAVYTSQADMETNAPAAGQYRVWTAGLASPSISSVTTSATGGTLPAGTYYYVVTALNANGETIGSTQSSVVTTGTTSRNTISYGAVAGATSYKLYVGTVSGGPYYYVSSTTVFAMLHSTPVGSGANPPTTNTASTGCYIRFGSKPVGIPTVNGINPATAGGAYKINDILDRLLKLSPLGFMTSTRVINSATLADAGLLVTGEMTYLQAYNALLSGRSLGFQYYRDNYIDLFELKDPTGQPSTYNLDSTNILRDSLKRVVPNDDDRGIPVWRVTLKYQHNPTIQRGTQMAGGATSADVAFAAEEWRSVVSEDATVKNTWRQAPEIVIESRLVDTTQAQTECDRVLALYKVARTMYTVDVPLNPFPKWIDSEPQPVPALGSVLTLTFPRFDLAAGKKLQVVGQTINCERSVRTLTLWG